MSYKILIKTPKLPEEGPFYQLEVHENMTIRLLKDKITREIEECKPHTIDEVKPFFPENPKLNFDDDKTLEYYGITEGSKLYCIMIELLSFDNLEDFDNFFQQPKRQK